MVYCVVGFDFEDYCWFFRVLEWKFGFKFIIFNRDYKLKMFLFFWLSIVLGEVILLREYFIKGLGYLIWY